MLTCKVPLWAPSVSTWCPKARIYCPSQTLKWRLHKFIKDLIEEGEVTNMTFFLSTKDNIKFQGVKKEVWKQVK